MLKIQIQLIINNKFEKNNLINSKVAEEQQPSNTVGQSEEEEEDN